LIHLDLSSNHITNEGAKRLAAAVPRCRRLVHLELQGNHIGHLGVGLLHRNWTHARKPEDGLIAISSDHTEKDTDQERSLEAVETTTSEHGDEHGEDITMSDFFYEGMYKNSQRHGLGTLSNRVTGFKYYGQFKDDLFEGHGEATWQDGSTYVGQWSEGQKCGKGEYTSGSTKLKTEGVRYVGDFFNGHRHGHGIQEYEDGGNFDGYWANGVCSGRGTYFFIDGSRYEGSWRNGRYNGPGTLTKPNGDTERLQYKDGLLMLRSVLHTDSLPVMMYTRSGHPAVQGPAKVLLRQARKEVHKPTQLPALLPSGNLIVREMNNYDLKAPALRPRSASRLGSTMPSLQNSPMAALPLSAR